MRKYTFSISKIQSDRLDKKAKREEISKGYLIRRSIRRFHEKPIHTVVVPDDSTVNVTVRLTDAQSEYLNLLVMASDELNRSQMISTILKYYL